MPFKLPKIYPITDTRLSGRTHLEQVQILASGGATIVQIRDKTALSGEIFDAVSEVIKFAREKDIRIIVNDRVDIALLTNADGVHLGQDDLPPEKAREILGPDAVIGLSTHSVEQAKQAIQLPIDYIAVGPIYATKSKNDPDSVVGVETIRVIRDVIGAVPLVAIGGISDDDLEAVFAAGADSAAVISAIVGHPGSVKDRFMQLTALAHSVKHL